MFIICIQWHIADESISVQGSFRCAKCFLFNLKLNSSFKFTRLNFKVEKLSKSNWNDSLIIVDQFHKEDGCQANELYIFTWFSVLTILLLPLTRHSRICPRKRQTDGNVFENRLLSISDVTICRISHNW